MNPFIQVLVEDLKQFSSELLASGLHGSQQVSAGVGSVANTTALLKSIDVLTALIPQLLSELQTSDTTRKVMLHYSSSPKQALFSRRAGDYQYDSSRKRLLPAHWISFLPVPEVDVRPMRWLLYLIELQETALNKIHVRTTKYIDDSLRIQQGDSNYAQNDRATLLGMRERLDEAQNKLEHARSTLLRKIEQRCIPTATLPDPYPRSPAWTSLRRYAQHLIQPDEYLPGFLHGLLNGTIEIADTPYLYQRWCGVKLLQAFEILGWVWHKDPVGALFLGGEVRLHKANVRISLWVEPRFSLGKVHPSGFSCREVLETHPDYLIVTPGPGGWDGFILDPTTTADIEVRRGKGKYLDYLEMLSTVAGVASMRSPKRAWSAAPIHQSHCELHDPEGYEGTIPMHPLDWSLQPLVDWTIDIESHALAWGNLTK